MVHIEEVEDTSPEATPPPSPRQAKTAVLAENTAGDDKEAALPEDDQGDVEVFELSEEDQKLCAEAFKTIDYNRSGCLDVEQVADAFTFIGLPLSKEKQDAIKGLLEQHGLKSVEFAEFVDLVMLVHRDNMADENKEGKPMSIAEAAQAARSRLEAEKEEREKQEKAKQAAMRQKAAKQAERQARARQRQEQAKDSGQPVEDQKPETPPLAAQGKPAPEAKAPETPSSEAPQSTTAESTPQGEESQEVGADLQAKLDQACEEAFWLTDDELNKFGEVFRKHEAETENCIEFIKLADVLRELGEDLQPEDQQEIEVLAKEQPLVDIVQALEIFASRRLIVAAAIPSSVVDELTTAFQTRQLTGRDIVRLCAQLGFPLGEDERKAIVKQGAAAFTEQDVLHFMAKQKLLSEQQQEPGPTQLSEEDITACQQQFDGMARSRGGRATVESREVPLLLDRLGVKLTREDHDSLMNQLRAQRMEVVEFDIFLDVVTQFVDQPASAPAPPREPSVVPTVAPPKKPTKEEVDAVTAARLAAVQAASASSAQKVCTYVLQGVALCVIIAIVFYLFDSGFRRTVNGVTRPYLGGGGTDAEGLDEFL
mmetsp:Transcript_17046/g.37526  ORF Transcript_17046/g.37526 Transcript_17046/m.37526 type:complete len:596 (+) Transcript_17046:49-1836(+)